MVLVNMELNTVMEFSLCMLSNVANKSLLDNSGMWLEMSLSYGPFKPVL